MKYRKPLVSVILPVHNDGHFLRESLKSILSQSYKNIEIIAIDDKSTDESYKILKTFRDKDKRLKISRNVKRYGIVMTLNRAVKKSKGEFIAFMGASDAMHRERVKKEVSTLLKRSEVLALGTQCMFIRKNNKKIKKSRFPIENRDIYSSPLHGFSLQFETMMINRNLLPKDILKFESNSHPFIYSDFLIKILPYGKFANLKEVLHYHRNNPKTYLTSAQKNIISYIKLWFRSITTHDYSPSIRSLFSPLFRTV